LSKKENWEMMTNVGGAGKIVPPDFGTKTTPPINLISAPDA